MEKATGKDMTGILILAVLIVLFFFIWSSRWTCANASIYSMYKGVLYRINLPNEMGRDGIAMEGLGSLIGNQAAGTLAG